MCYQCNKIKANMREKWIKLHLEQNISLLELSRTLGLHRNSLSNWKNNYLRYGLAGLIDKSRKPHSHPNQYSQSVIDKIKQIRLDSSNKRAPGPIEIKARLHDEYGIDISRSGIAKRLKSDQVKLCVRCLKPKNSACLLATPAPWFKLINLNIIKNGAI